MRRSRPLEPQMGHIHDKVARDLIPSRSFGALSSSGITIRFLALIGFLVLVSAVLYSREFSGPEGPASPFYSHLAFGFRWIDVILLTSSTLALVIHMPRRAKIWQAIGRQLAVPIFLFFASIFISLVYGFINSGGKELFYEWRAIALGLLVGSAFRLFMTARYLYVMAYGVFFVVSAHSLFLLVKWVLFGGVPPYNGPTFDGPTLSNAVAAVSLGVVLFSNGSERKRFRSFIFVLFIVTNITLVLLAFRRTYWAELLVVIGALGVLYRRIRFWVLSFAAIGFVIMILTIPKEEIWSRVGSIVYFFDMTNPYASTNIGHLEDILDAVLQIQKSPIFGIGLGTAYETIYTMWKVQSWGVHNAPLHVWLRFGLLGLLAYLWFHWRVASFLWFHRQLVLTRALLAYWVAIFAPTLFFSPWPYGALQNTLLLGVLFALADTEINYWRRMSDRYPYHS